MSFSRPAARETQGSDGTPRLPLKAYQEFKDALTEQFVTGLAPSVIISAIGQMNAPPEVVYRSLYGVATVTAGGKLRIRRECIHRFPPLLKFAYFCPLPDNLKKQEKDLKIYPPSP